MVHHDAPHQLGGDREKMRPVLPDRMRLISQTQVGVVHQNGRLQCVSGTLLAHVVMRQLMQYRLNQGDQFSSAVESPLRQSQSSCVTSCCEDKDVVMPPADPAELITPPNFLKELGRLEKIFVAGFERGLRLIR